MDHHPRWQTEPRSQACLSRRATHAGSDLGQRLARDQQRGACDSVNRSVDTATAEQALVGRVDHRVAYLRGEITSADDDPGERGTLLRIAQAEFPDQRSLALTRARSRR
jgi:hypothetical protein